MSSRAKSRKSRVNNLSKSGALHSTEDEDSRDQFQSLSPRPCKNSTRNLAAEASRKTRARQKNFGSHENDDKNASKGEVKDMSVPTRLAEKLKNLASGNSVTKPPMKQRRLAKEAVTPEKVGSSKKVTSPYFKDSSKTAGNTRRRKTNKDDAGCKDSSGTVRKPRKRKMDDNDDNRKKIKDNVCQEIVSDAKTNGFTVDQKVVGDPDPVAMEVDYPTLSNAAEIKTHDSDSDSSDSCWEEVEDIPTPSSSNKDVVPQAIQVTVADTEMSKGKKKTRAEKIQEYFRRMFNRYKKETLENIHRVHLLCLLAHGHHLQTLSMNQLLIAQALSIIPNELMKRPIKRYDVSTVHLLCLLAHGHHLQTLSMNQLLIAQALSIIPNELMKRPIKRYDVSTIGGVLSWFRNTVVLDTVESADKEKLVCLQSISTCFESGKTSSQKEYVCMFFVVMVTLGVDVRLVMSLQPVPFKAPSKKNSPVSKRPSTAKTSKKSIKLSDKVKNEGKFQQSQMENTKKSSQKRTQGKVKNRLPRQCSSKAKAIVDTSSDDEDYGDDIVRGEGETSVGGNRKENTKQGKNAKNDKKKKTRQLETPSEMSSDSDFEPEMLSPRSSHSKTTTISATESCDVSPVNVEGDVNEWIEVYLPSEKRWTCLDCVSGTTDSSSAMERLATRPVSYILAFDNDGCVKDVTARYASRWMSQTRKIRLDPDWWTETLAVYKTKKRKRDKEEDDVIKSKLLSQPFPTSISDFKDHPLYALKRHLLKFEAIYPDTAVPLGYIRGEAIYARECVHGLHSRETWLKEARTVRVGESAYKMVKPRINPRKPHLKTGEATLEVFGRWQTEDYIPPIAVDGKVPRNEYGNVEMFKPCMLPGGTVHLKITGLNKVARKIGIDCVPAMVGWDFHGGYAHAIIDGYIVCEEMKDTLLAAWNQEQEIIQEKETQKREKRVIEHWTTLTRGLLIRERLEKKYNLQKKPESLTTDKTEKATDVEASWPRNRETKKPAGKKTKKEQAHLFPFEKM